MPAAGQHHPHILPDRVMAGADRAHVTKVERKVWADTAGNDVMGVKTLGAGAPEERADGAGSTVTSDSLRPELTPFLAVEKVRHARSQRESCLTS